MMTNRCEVTGNPCGTDTSPEGRPCQCKNCRDTAMNKYEQLKVAVQDLLIELDIDPIALRDAEGDAAILVDTWISAKAAKKLIDAGVCDNNENQVQLPDVQVGDHLTVNIPTGLPNCPIWHRSGRITSIKGDLVTISVDRRHTVVSLGDIEKYGKAVKGDGGE